MNWAPPTSSDPKTSCRVSRGSQIYEGQQVDYQKGGSLHSTTHGIYKLWKCNDETI